MNTFRRTVRIEVSANDREKLADTLRELSQLVRDGYISAELDLGMRRGKLTTNIADVPHVDVTTK